MQRFAIIHEGTTKFHNAPDIGHVMVYFRFHSITAITEGCWMGNYTSNGTLLRHAVVVRCPDVEVPWYKDQG